MQRQYILCGLIMSVLALPCYAQKFIVSENITRVTRPLTRDGQIDFFKAIEARCYPPELKTDDNGFRLFVRQFGDVSDTANNQQVGEFYRLQKYEKLGLDPNTKPTLTFPDTPQKVYEAFIDKNDKEGEMPRWHKTNFGSTPWTLEEFPMFADWIKRIDEPLDAIAEMIRKPIFYAPLLQSPESIESGKPQNLMSVLLPDIQQHREIARMFQARAMYRIGQGNIDGAIEDKLTIHRFGRHVAPRGCLVPHLVGIAIEGMGASIPVGTNPEHPLTQEQIQRLLDGLDALPPRASLEDDIEWERYAGLGCVQDMTSGGEESFADVGLDNLGQFLRIFPPNWNLVFVRMNEAYDVLQRQSSEEIDAMLKAKEEAVRAWNVPFRLMTASGRGAILADLMICLLVPAVDAAAEAVRRSECMENMQRLTLTILQYKNEHGKLPGENWVAEIGVSARWLSCPSNVAEEGMTTYALVQYGKESADTVGGSLDTILLVELTEAVPFDKAFISVDEVLVLACKPKGNAHPGGMNVGYRSGAVRFLPPSINEEELRRQLGL